MVPPSGIGGLSAIQQSYYRKPRFSEERKVKSSKDVGCEDLRKIVDQIKPKYHLFGHIHSGYGIYKNQNTTFINCAILNGNFEDNLPIEFLYL